MKTKKLLALILSIIMMLSATGINAFAEETIQPASDAVVYVTISNCGMIAADNEGLPMVNRSVTVTDVNCDGILTYDEALMSAHETYNSEENFAAPNGYVSKLWGVDTGNTLFFINNKGIESGVAVDSVKEGDKLVASINQDNVYWADWYTFFDATEKTVKVNEQFSLTLKGHLGMAYLEEDKEDIPLSGISLGLWKDGVFNAIDEAKTDENGEALMSFDETGVYYIVALGTVSDEVTDYNLMDLGGEPSVYGTMDFTTFDSYVAYTEDDYGEGPYPASEIKYVAFEEWNENQENFYALQSNKIVADCPIITSGCKVEVVEKTEATIAHNIAAKYSDGSVINDANFFWLLADLADYQKAYPETEYVLSDEQKQKCVDKIIEFADNATSPGDLSKAIISLRSLGYDAKNTYTKSREKLDIADKLAKLVDEKASSVTNIYTLPYVMIALNEGEGYATEEQMEYLKNAAVMSKESWQSTAWGTDGLTPMMIALSPYFETDDSIKELLLESADIIKACQEDSGHMGNAASTGLCIAALTSIGIDCQAVVKNDITIFDGLLSFATVENDGFEPMTNSFSTEQGFRGVLAYELAKNGERIYDFKSYPLETAYATWAENCPVTFEVVPNGAKVSIEGYDAIGENGFDLPEGTYTYTVTKSGYKTKKGEITITEEEASSHILKTVRLSLSSSGNSESSEISVKIKVMLHDAHDCNNSYTYTKKSSRFEALIDENVRVKKGKTVFDVLAEVLDENDISYTEASYGYISSIDGVSEFDHGEKSGWMFMVNGKLTETGSRDTKLKSDSTLIWFYTDDYTKEKGSEKYPSSTSSSSTDKKGNVGIVITPDEDKKSDIEEEKDVDLQAVENIFGDVKKGDWYYDAVSYVYENGLMSGTGVDFEPETTMTRAMLVTALYRLEKDTEKYHDSSFSDVKEDAWYYDAVNWAVENGVVNGMSEDEFAPNKEISREQTAVILYRYACLKGYSAEEKSDINMFSDNDKISEWASDGVSWVSAVNLINGTTETEFSPKMNTTRAQLAVILMRLCEKYELN